MVTLDTGAQVIGYVSAINEKDPQDQIPEEFRGYLDIMSQEAAEALPAHQPYDCKIDLKEGETAPWGPIYPLFGKRAPDPQGMAQGNAKDRQNSKVHLTGRIPDFVHTKTKWKRTPAMCQLPSSSPDNNSQPIPPSPHARTAGSSPGGQMVH